MNRSKKKGSIFQGLYPDDYVGSAYDINYESLYDRGYRGLIFDIDNTLVPHGKPADKRAVMLFRRLKKLGFKCCLLSNNKENRVKTFNDRVHVFYISDAHKPSRKNYIKAMDLMNTNTGNTAFVGDQLFTDVWGARRSHVFAVLVRPMHPKEEIQIVFKRYLERIVLYFYKRSG